MSESKIIDKIQKLLALAERAGTEAEAESAFEKARALMVQHAIEESALKAGGDAKAEPIVERFIQLKERDEIRQAKGLLLNAIAKANRCKVLLYRNTISIIGYESDTVFVEMLWNSVLIQMLAARSRAWSAYQRETPTYLQSSRYIFVNQFALGYAGKIGQRLVEAAARQHSETVGTDLVLRDRSQDVDDWFANAHPKVGKSKAIRRSGDANARNAGFRAGGSADLSGGRNNIAGRKSVGA